MNISNALVAGVVLTATFAGAEESTAPVQARWQARDVQATFAGLHTAYNCDAVEHRLQRMLAVLGAHPHTNVLVTGCATNRIAKTFFIRVKTATAVPANQPNESDAKEELLRRIGSKSVYGAELFPATWKTIDLTKVRELHFEPGDCELLELIQEQILPKLGAEVSAVRLHCTPGRSLGRLPAFPVTMLVAGADKR
jgi:hypothetical protein